jgi:hypothetical protein
MLSVTGKTVNGKPRKQVKQRKCQKHDKYGNPTVLRAISPVAKTRVL